MSGYDYWASIISEFQPHPDGFLGVGLDLSYSTADLGTQFPSEHDIMTMRTEKQWGAVVG